MIPRNRYRVRTSPEAPSKPADGPALLRGAGLWLALVVFLISGGGGSIAAAQVEPRLEEPPEAPDSVRIFFVTDIHSRQERLDAFIRDVNAQRPTLVLDGGDMVHDGTEAELRRAFAGRSRLESPWFAVRGNHDVERRGPFTGPAPEIPAFQAFDHAGIRFVLLDNHAQVFAEEQLERLGAELREHEGRRIVVVMHVPPLLSREPFTMRLRHLLPYRLASPVVRDPDQVARFTALVERYGVLAVVAGHAHFMDYQLRNGVHYIVGGTAGGLTPGTGIDHEYLDITIRDRHVLVQRVTLAEGVPDPMRLVARTFEFYAQLNRFNHAQQGWNYVPSASVQFKGGLTRSEARGEDNVAIFAAAGFERSLGSGGRQAFFTDVGVTSGPAVLTADLALGYKLRLVGNYNRGLFAGGAGTASGGVRAREATAGVGAMLTAGLEWRSLTVAVARGFATDHRSSSFAVGGRF